MNTFLKNTLFPGHYPDYVSVAILVLRLTVGTFMFTHGLGKFWMFFSNEPIMFADPIGLGFTATLVLAVFAEMICSVLLILGVATRWSAVPLLVTMLIAGLVVHAADPFMVKELAFLYSSLYVVLILLGSGKYSLDYLFFRK